MSRRYPDRLCTLEECARELGVTPERARQIEASALAKVRRALEARGIGPEDMPERLEGMVSRLEQPEGL